LRRVQAAASACQRGVPRACSCSLFLEFLVFFFLIFFKKS
jgi:hypothetical protein